MAKKENKIKETKQEENTIEVVKSDNSNLPPEAIPQKVVSFKEGIAPYIVFLEAMRSTKKHVDTAPTFTPKNFYESIQFYDTGGVRRLYLYINGDWRYVVLT